MEFFRLKKDIPFMRHALWFNIASIAMFLLAVFFLVFKGLHLSVEFTGGTLIELHYNEAPQLEQIRQTLAANNYTEAQVQNFGTTQDVLIRIPNSEGLDTDQLSAQVMQTLTGMGGEPPALKRVEFVGPQVGKELAYDGSMALLFVLIGIMIYLAFRFEWRFSVAAMFANMHDVVIILGFFACFQWEFSLPVLAATLAVLGYSVNESVIVFDRVRETFRKRRDLNTPQVLDHAITMTMSRTVITHGSTLMIALSMLIFGGETLHYFALALTIGILFGVYSSIFVSSPIAMWLGVSREHFIQAKKEKQEAVV